MTFCTTQEKRGTNNSKNGTVELFHKRVKCWGVFHSVTMSNEGNRKCTEAKKRTTGTEGDLPKGVVSERTRGSRELAAPAMMVIDAFTIQMPQTAQQIKRLSCRVVKYNNSTHTHIPAQFCQRFSFCLTSLVSLGEEAVPILSRFLKLDTLLCCLCTYGSV